MAATDDNPPVRKPRWYPLGPMPPERSNVPLWWSDPNLVIIPLFIFSALVLTLVWALMQPAGSELNNSIKVLNPEPKRVARGEAEEAIWAMVPGKSHPLAFEPADQPRVVFLIDETGIQRIERINARERPKLAVVTRATHGDVYIVIVGTKSVSSGYGIAEKSTVKQSSVKQNAADHDTVQKWFGLPSRQKELVDGLQAMAKSTEVLSEAERHKRRAVDALELLDPTIRAAGNRDYLRGVVCLSVDTQKD